MANFIEKKNSNPYEYKRIAEARGIKVVVKKFFPNLDDCFVTSGPGRKDANIRTVLHLVGKDLADK